MAEELTISTGSKKEKYETLVPQIKAMLSVEKDLIANMANVSAMIKDTFNFLWVGFYRVMKDEKHEEVLVLGPFQGPLACTRIKKGRGVCGGAWKDEKTLVVPNVDEFPGHIACSSLSKSEIVLPMKKDNKVYAVLDIDSLELNTFDEEDKYYLEQIVELF
ncbi:MAG: GAF domain-containing protein [Bacteroidales bacterium]|nr:GAF domain-containing protein [Bacteroidales bacterium]